MSNVQTAKPTLAYGALAAGIIGVITGVINIPVAAWVLGAIGLVLGFLAYREPATTKLGTIAMAIGFVSVLVGVFFFSMNITA